MTDYSTIYAEGKPPVLPCPVCGAPPSLRSWQNFVSSQYHHVLSLKHTVMGSAIVPLVCTSCGYIQLFTDPKDFRQ